MVTTMTPLQELITGCKASVRVTVNEHIDDCRTVREYVDDARRYQSELPTAEMEEQMVAANTVVEIQFYPRTPIGFEKVWHSDVELGLAEAVSILRDLQAKGQA